MYQVFLKPSNSIKELYVVDLRVFVSYCEGLPCRFRDLIHIFGRPVPELCLIANQVTDHIFNLLGHRISQWDRDLLQPKKLQQYADAITNKGTAFYNCFGFVDGIVPPICRPGRYQRLVYNGHKRVHAYLGRYVKLCCTFCFNKHLVTRIPLVIPQSYHFTQFVFLHLYVETCFCFWNSP